MEIKKMEEKKVDSPSCNKATLNICCFRINKVMLRFKFHFFLFIGAMGSVLVYIPVIAQSRIGISATALATVVTTQRLITIFTKPGIGYLVDYFNKLKLIIVSLIVTQTAFLFLILIVPTMKHFPGRLTDVNIANQFNVSEQDAEFFTVAISSRKYCENISENVSVSNEYGVEEDKMDIFCVLRYNTTSLLCFEEEKENYVKKHILEKDSKMCCTINFSKNKLYNDYLQDENRKTALKLSPVQHNISLEALNKPFLCTRKDIYYPLVETYTGNDFETLEYWIFAFILVCTGICTSSIFTLADIACFESVQKYGGDFGRQRIYGAVGWGAIGPISGLLIDLTNDYLAAWILMACLQLLALCNILKLDLTKPHFSQNILKDVAKVVKSSEFIAFELGVFINGMGAGIMWTYLAWFLTSLGGSRFLVGLAQYVQCFGGEIPFMFFSSRIIKKLGHMNLLSLALVSYAARFMWYSYLQNPWLVLPIEIAHGFTYGTFYPTIASFGKMNAKPGTEATTQSIIFSTHDGLGAGVGCVLTGLAIDHFGVHQTFRYIGIFYIGALLLNIFNTLLIGRRTKVLKLSNNSVS